MSEPHTLESFDALPDDAARDAAIARALGFCRGPENEWRRGDWHYVGPVRPWTGDAPALCREMRDALQAWVLEHYPTYELRCCWWAEGGTYEIVLIPNDDGYDEPETWPLEVMGSTEAQAWGNALVAAGLVQRGADDA